METLKIIAQKTSDLFVLIVIHKRILIRQEMLEMVGIIEDQDMQREKVIDRA